MYPSKIDLPADQRAKVVALLNDRLADLIDLYMQSKQAHWNVKGPDFYQLHLLFDAVATAVEPFIDETAERITTLGGTADGTLGGVGKRTKLTPYSVDIIKGREHLEALSTALATEAKHIRAAIDQADELGDKDTADLFTGVSRELDKQLWFVEAHLQAEH